MSREKKNTPDDYPLRLTQKQRESLLQFTRLERSLEKKLGQAGEGTQTVLVSGKELDDLHDRIIVAAMTAPGPDKKRLHAVLQKVTESFETAEDTPSAAVTKSIRRRGSSRDSSLLYQFRITLLDIRPPIWRRIQVPDCTLDMFHDYIQAAFGWENYHLHQFEIDGVCYGPPEPDGMDFGLGMEDEGGAALSALLPKAKKKARWVYEYDFGDGWRHGVEFEGNPPTEQGQKYPLCVEGKRACPPEDCGGPWGYADYLAAIADPKHERHDELLEWRGPFDPEVFDAKKATKEMRQSK